ncbi:MAG: hypothetical protein JNK27_15250 [Chitinophagaceae bacterium]|nr:hypothetical protein [Chitinophagaceae bacterium]
MKKIFLLLSFWVSINSYSQFGLENIGGDVKTAADKLSTSLGGQLVQAIEILNLVLKERLEAILQQLDMNGKIDNVNQALGKEVAALREDIDRLSNNIVIASNSIPLSKKVPQISAYSYIDIPTGVRVIVKGNFLALRQQDETITIQSKLGKELEYNERLNNFFTFDIPLENLTQLNNSVSDNYFVLKIPYRKGFKNRIAAYTINIRRLPSALGTLLLTQQKKVTTYETKDIVSPEMKQESNNDDLKGVLHCWDADPGWFVKKESVGYRLTREQGRKGKEWWDDGNHSTDKKACFAFTTIHKGFGKSGKIYFNLTFTQYRNLVSLVMDTLVNSQINYTELRTFELPDGNSWKVKFLQFDGEVYEFNSNFETKYFKFTREGNYLVMRQKK